jgi:multidrug efflux pump subunit AcrA (membrane-fusion protein)
VAKGDSVSKGELLVTLNASTSTYNLQSYKDARDVAIKDKQIYVENYETNMNVVGGEDEYRLNVARLDELISRAEATYKAQQSMHDNSFIYAPFDGIVLDISKKEGDSALSFETIVKVADVNELYFEIKLDQEDFGTVGVNQNVEITLDPYEDKTFVGKIDRLPQYANGGVSPGFVVEIPFDTNQEGILLGMTGDAKIITDTTESPVGSLLYDEVKYDVEEKPYVWVVQNNILKRKYIEIGLEGDIFTEVKTPMDEKIYTAIGGTEIEEGFTAIIQK